MDTNESSTSSTSEKISKLRELIVQNTLVVENVDDGAKKRRREQEIDKIIWEILEPDDRNVIINEASNRKMINSCRTFVAGGASFEEFSRKVREYDDAPACGLVWAPNYVAYRCQTCSLTPCMSLCSDCFLAGDHEGHDYNMFKSQAGGACDCGDASVLKESGFCPKHASARRERKSPPEDLLTMARYVLPHIYSRLLFYFREYNSPTSFVECGSLVAFLQSLSDLGAAMKNVLCAAMLDEGAYKRLTKTTETAADGDESSPPQADYISRSASFYRTAVESIASIATRDDADALDCPELCAGLEHGAFVDEFMFWLLKFEFPQKLITFLLSLLSNEEYKVRFADAFVQHYTRIAALLSTARAADTANRVIHMSVQLMSGEPLAARLNRDHKLLRILVVSLHNMIKKGLTECTLHTGASRNFHRVADCSSPIMENHNYWALASDLHNVLGHKALVRAFLRDPALVDLWCNFIAFFQGMNVNTRQLEQHLEYESRSYYPAFTAEIEICSSIMWSLVRQLKHERLYDCILYTVQYVLGQIQEWFENIHFVSDTCWKPPQLSMTFHLPLHRLYAAFVRESINMGMQVLFPSETFLRQLFMHPLQIQVIRSEISAGMWVRNGQSMRYQSCLYVQSHFCASFIDLDLYLLQICGARVHPDWLILTVFERFHTVEWLSFAPAYPTKRFLRPEWEAPMLEGALRLIATLVCKTTYLGMSEEDIMRLEVATLLATGNKTHSQILDQLPDTFTPGQSLKLTEKILEELATYQPPQFEPGGSMRQGNYVPKDVVWLRYFDPLFVMTRSLQMKEYQDAFMRYTDFVRKTGMYKKKSPPWAPFRIPSSALPAYDALRRILHCRSLHAILYVILFKAVSEICPVSDHAIYLAIYLLELAIQLPPPGAAISEAVSKHHVVLNLQFCGWFPGNCLSTNLCHRIDRILHIDNMPGLSRSYQDDSNTDADFPDLVRLRARLSKSSFATTPDNQLVPSQVPHSRSDHIPFIDSIESDYDLDTDYFYNKAIACLPDALRRQYLTASPERLALTLDGEKGNSSKQEEEDEQMVAISSSSVEIQSADQHHQQLAIGGSENRERSLVLKQPGDMVRAQIQRIAAATSTDCDGSASLGSSSMEEMLALPSSAPPPHGLPQPKVHVVNSGESLVTLLVKLHNKLADDHDPYQPPTEDPSTKSAPDQQQMAAGDGQYYIRSLLDRIYFLTPACRREIDSLLRGPFASPAKSAGQPSSEDVQRAKRKAAKERQQRLMAQFTSKQKAVMDQLLQQESTLSEAAAAAGASDDVGESAGPSGGRSGPETETESLQCVICNQASTILLQRPIGLVTLATATSVFGKSYPEGEPFINSIFELTEAHKSINRGRRESDHYQRLLTSACKKLSIVLSTSPGWEGGVHLSTCGHHVHIDCQDAYMQSVRADSNRMEAGTVLATSKGEFFCPLCRQLANCVMPSVVPAANNDQQQQPGDWSAELITTTTTGQMQQPCRSDYVERVAWDIMKVLEAAESDDVSPLEGTPAGAACDRFVDRLMEATYPAFLQFMTGLEDGQWAFLCGVVRTNLEARNSNPNASPSVQKRSCLRTLLNLLPGQMHDLEDDYWYSCRLEWSSLCGGEEASGGAESASSSSSLANVRDDAVPFVLRDPAAVLIRLTLALVQQRHNSKDHFAVVCRAVHNLVVFQSIVNVIDHHQQRSIATIPRSILRKTEENLTSEDVISSGEIHTLAAFILKSCYSDKLEEALREIDGWMEKEKEEYEEKQFNLAIESRCVPFLRLAAMLKHYAVDGSQAGSSSSWWDQDARSLRSYLFGDGSIVDSEEALQLQWPVNRGGESVLRNWMGQVERVRNNPAWAQLLSRPLLWASPRLIPLPKQFDLLFQRYHKSKCRRCGTCPKESLLCLVCGELVCYRSNCCSAPNSTMTELETHSVDCGAGLAVYVSVHTSTVLVTRGKKAAHWGSLYLDAHGEEDRGLKRGKPLFLSEERFAALERAWLTHSFESACKRWFWIGQSWANVVIPL